jgi:CubicO group peptidase (beta-lactamase class C family)
MACAEKLLSPPGAVLRYSDINFFLLGEVVRRVSGMMLNEFVAREIYQPLKMVDTGYLPAASKLPRIAPTERIDGKVLRGIVHDPTARLMGGVAGHAGIFTTAADLGRYARMLLNLGELDGVRVFQPETVALMTSVQTPEKLGARRGLGWDIDSGYSRPRGKIFPLGSYGHTGFTGTALWIDPFSKTFWVFLTNRVHPDRNGNVLALEGTLGSLAAQAVIGFNFSYVPGSLPARPSEADQER